ncbi:9667_t:CDS:2, partial [Scutellospora calospora]
SKSKNIENEEPNSTTNQKGTEMQAHSPNRVLNEALEPNISWAEETENTYGKGELPLQKNPVQSTTVSLNEKSENLMATRGESSGTNEYAMTDEAESDDSDITAETDLETMQLRDKTTIQTCDSHNKEMNQTEERQIPTSGTTVDEEAAEILLAREIETTENTSRERVAQDENRNVSKNQNIDEGQDTHDEQENTIQHNQNEMQKTIEIIPDDQTEDWERSTPLEEEEGFTVVTKKKRNTKLLLMTDICHNPYKNEKNSG